MRGLWIAARAQTTFGRAVMAGGLMLILFVYVFVKYWYGEWDSAGCRRTAAAGELRGSALIVLMAGFGIVMSIHTHRKNVVKSV